MDVEDNNNKNYRIDEATKLLAVTERKYEGWKAYSNEIKHVLKLTLPLMVYNCFHFTIITETIIMCGMIGSTEMAAATLANSLSNIFGFCIATGFGTACDTLFSQIYGGRHRNQLGIVVQRSVLAALVLPLLLIPLSFNWEPLLLLVGQDPTVSRYAAEYLKIFSPGLIFVFEYQVLTRYLQNQYYVFVPMVIIVVGNLFNITSQYIVIVIYNYSFHAAALCQTLTYFLIWLMFLIYILVSGVYKSHWNGWSRDCLLEWHHFFKLAILGIGSIFLDFAGWEILTLASGVIGITELAAQSISWNYVSFLYSVGFAVGASMNIRVGEALGKGDHNRARLSNKCGLIIIGIFDIITILVGTFSRNYVGYVFTNDYAVVSLVSEIFPMVIIANSLDLTGAVVVGSLRGCGLQKVGLISVTVAFYLIAFPIAFPLAFLTDLKIKGIWIGTVVGLLFGLSCNLTYVFCVINWKDQVKIAQQRIRQALTLDRNCDIDDIKNFKNDNCKKTCLSGSIKVHKRNISTSFSYKDGQVKPIRIYVSDKQYRKVYIKRIALFAVCIIFLIIGCACSQFIYYPNPLPNRNNTNLVNSTML